MDFFTDIKKIIQKKIPAKSELEKIKLRLARKYSLPEIPKDSEIMLKTNLNITSKKVRTLSGVAPIAIMTKPYPCPHGKCIYCPGGPLSKFNSPQSYTGEEPSTKRAIRNNYDPYLIVFNRLEQYICLNQSPQKTEIIIQGGTFPSFPRHDQEEIITYSLKALNDFSKMFYKNKKFQMKKFKEFFLLPSNYKDEERTKNIQKKLLKLKKTSNLQKEQKINETSQIRCVGLTIETRPDYGLLKHANFLLKLGCTRIELGIQTLNPKTLQIIKRGHTLDITKKSLQVLKDLGFKINVHMMLGLPHQNPIKEFKELFASPNYRPDMLKIYPCLVVEGTELHKLWKLKKYIPLSTQKAAVTIAEIKKIIPIYCRIMRIQRDIPSTQISAGPIQTNLRQLVQNICIQKNIKCQCIRCREPKGTRIENPQLFVEEYSSSNGKELFISLEEKNKIIGFCRLRFPSEHLRKEITKNSAIIRELHVYSESLPIDAQPNKNSLQHRGFGKLLLNAAEELCKEYKKSKLIIISGIGAREYYKKHSYKHDGPYMSKKL